MSKRKAKIAEKKRLICIRWLDHTSKDDWIEEKNLQEECGVAEMLSVGWLVCEDERAYYLAGTLATKDKSVGDSRCILKGAVVKVLDIDHE